MREDSRASQDFDPALLADAQARAAELGVSVDDYLTDTVLRRVLADEASLEPSPYIAPAEEPSDSAEAPENLAIRNGLVAFRRRLGQAIGGLDDALLTLDTSFSNLAARVAATESLAVGATSELASSTKRLGHNLQALDDRIADAESGLAAVHATNEAAHHDFAGRFATLGQRLACAEETAKAADRATAVLRDAHESHKSSIARDIADLARETADAIGRARASADAATEAADATAARVVEDLRQLREALEGRIAASEAAARDAAQAVFAEVAQRITNVDARAEEAQRVHSTALDELRVQFADAQDGAQLALEETAEALRARDATLAAEIARSTLDGRVALDAVQSKAASAIAELRESDDMLLAKIARAEKESRGALEAARAVIGKEIAELRAGDAALTATVAESAQEGRRAAEAMQGALAKSIRDSHDRDADLAAQLARAEQERQRVSDAQRDLAARVAELDNANHDLSARVESVASDGLAGLETLRRETFQAHEALAQDDAELAQRIAESNKQCNASVAALERQQSSELRGVEVRLSKGLEAARALVSNAAADLRVSDSALAAEIALAKEESRVALEVAQRSLSGELSQLRESQAHNSERIAFADAAISANREGLSTLRSNLNTRLDEMSVELGKLAGEDANTARGIEELGLGLAGVARDGAQARFALGAEIERVEACTLAALEQVSAAMKAGEARYANDIANMRSAIEGHVENSALESRRLVVKSQETAEAALAALAQSTTEQLLDLRKSITRIESSEALRTLQLRLDEIGAVVASHDIDAGETAERLQRIAGILSNVTTESAEAAAQTHDRLRQVEQALAETRAADANVMAIAQRLMELESRQDRAFEALRDDITDFIEANETRLAAIETPSAAETQDHGVDVRDLAEEFVQLRQRIEDRIHGLEQRSVRALEQVGETVALIERRLGQSEDDWGARSA